MGVILSLYLSSTPVLGSSDVPGAAEAMDLIREDLTPVIEFSMDWSVRVALGLTSTHAFVVLCKRFLGP
jgi:hypothetical protein